MTLDCAHPADGPDGKDTYEGPKADDEVTGPCRDLLLALPQRATPKGWWEVCGDSPSAGYQQFIGLEDKASFDRRMPPLHSCRGFSRTAGL